MLRPTFRLGRVRGIEIGIHWSLLVVGLLITSSLAGGILPSLEPDAGGNYWAAAVLATALFFGSVLAHELSHALVALRRGQRVDGITLWLLGGVAQLRDEAKDARSEFLVAAAGPATSIGLGVAFIGAAIGLELVLADGSLLPAVALYLGLVNLVLAAFNLLPGAPLDGGRILSSAVWGVTKDRRRAQIVAARAGFGLGVLLIAAGLLGFFFAIGWGNLWTALVGWFVIDASRSEELNARVSRSLDDHAVSELMAPVDERPEWTTVDDLRAEHPALLPSSVLLTGFDGRPRALLQTGALRAVPSPAGPLVRLREFAVPIERVPRVTPETPARAALELGVPVLVTVDERVVGVVGLDEVRRAAGRDALSARG